MELAFSQACENNKPAILSVLKQAFSTTKNVLEIGSGTGQHAIHFAEHLPQLVWQTSDLPINHYSINQRVINSGLNNILEPMTLDLTEDWSFINDDNTRYFDGIFTANTLHIVSWPLVQRFFTGVGNNLAKEGTLCIYGPFNYDGEFTSASNQQFDLWLKERDQHSGIRDFEAIVTLANAAGLSLITDHTMPANNRLLAFRKTS